MGNVQALMTVMPTGVDVDLDELEERISLNLPEAAKLQDSDTEEVAFGLKSLQILVTVPDDAGGTEKVEGRIQQIEGVESVQVGSVTRD